MGMARIHIVKVGVHTPNAQAFMNVLDSHPSLAIPALVGSTLATVEKGFRLVDGDMPRYNSRIEQLDVTDNVVREGQIRK